jgi:hypothetical protein
MLLMVPGVATAHPPVPFQFRGTTHSALAGNTTETIVLDVQTCAAIGAGTGCTLTISTTVSASKPSAPVGANPTLAVNNGGNLQLAAASATQCHNYYLSLQFGWLGISLMTDEIDVPMCWNGVVSWRNGWGPDCKISQPWGYTFTLTWCDMYGNNSPSTQAGDNWHIQPYLPLSTSYYWARLNFWGNGYSYWTGGQG